MAIENVKHQWDDQRRLLCLEGVWELDKIARVLPDLVPLDDDQNHYAVKAMAGRMLRLTNMLMSALDHEEPNDKLKRAVNFWDRARLMYPFASPRLIPENPFPCGLGWHLFREREGTHDTAT